MPPTKQQGKQQETIDYTKYVINCKKAEPNPDAIHYRPMAIEIGTTVTLPKSASLENKIPFIFDQSTLGSCVSNAISLCISTLNNDFIPSRLFIYYNARLNSGYDITKDTGLSVYDGCLAVKTNVPCQESVWPYDINNFTTKPIEQAYNSPVTLNDYTYLPVIQDINHIKGCINEGLPVVFSINLYSSFYDATYTGIVKLPDMAKDTFHGGHCILLVGYDDDTQTVICANSWGIAWGNSGYFTLPYAYAFSTELAHDFYTINFANKKQSEHTNIERICQSCKCIIC